MIYILFAKKDKIEINTLIVGLIKNNIYIRVKTHVSVL